MGYSGMIERFYCIFDEEIFQIFAIIYRFTLRLATSIKRKKYDESELRNESGVM